MEVQILLYMAPRAIHMQKNARRGGKLKKTRWRESRTAKTANMSCALRTPQSKLCKYARPPATRSNQIFMAKYSVEQKYENSK
jgi:hypothetical protein